MPGKPDDYQFYLSLGICPKCRKRKVFEGMSMCPECEEKHTIEVSKYMQKPDYNSHKSQYLKSKYYERKEQGLCVKCGKVKAERGIYCYECWRKERKSHKTKGLGRGYLWKERAAAGACLYCGKPVVPGYGYCEEHLPARQELGKKWGQANKNNNF